MTLLRTALRYCVGLFFVFLFLGVLSGLKFLYFPVIIDPQGYHYVVKSGTSSRSVVDDLYFKKIITNRYYFNLLVRFRVKSQALKAGEYFFPKGSTPLTIVNQMITGRGMIYHEFTIVPGWTFQELRRALLSDVAFHHILQDWSDFELMKYLKHPEWAPEGEFFPDTYYFSAGSSDIALLKRAFKKMQLELNHAWAKRKNNLPFRTSYEILIAASLIEKEAFLNHERPLIAGVLVNRLHHDMLLQFDPTVIYGLGEQHKGKISKEDLGLDTPYNTYLHKGLPPTPIATPSLESIWAVANPAEHAFLYFVAKGDGSHQFSENLDDHVEAVALYKKLNSSFFWNDELLTMYFNETLGVNHAVYFFNH